MRRSSTRRSASYSEAVADVLNGMNVCLWVVIIALLLFIAVLASANAHKNRELKELEHIRQALVEVTGHPLTGEEINALAALEELRQEVASAQAKTLEFQSENLKLTQELTHCEEAKEVAERSARAAKKTAEDARKELKRCEKDQDKTLISSGLRIFLTEGEKEALITDSIPDPEYRGTFKNAKKVQWECHKPSRPDWVGIGNGNPLTGGEGLGEGGSLGR